MTRRTATRLSSTLWWAFVFTASYPVLFSQGFAANLSPEVSIVWPHQGDGFSYGTLIKIKAEASDLDGSVARVCFFADTNLIGIVTNGPFNILWQVDRKTSSGGTWAIKAVAIDNSGATNESDPITVVYYTGAPPQPVVEIVSPNDGAILPAPATFVFSAEVLASLGDTGPVEYYVGSDLAGIFDQVTNFSAATPPSSITVSNLVEGEYDLAVIFLGANGCHGCPPMPTRRIRVTKLGVQMPGVTLDGRIQFEVVTSFPGLATIVEASSDLVGWIPIRTNRPSSNSFIFTESLPPVSARRFYRVFLPPEQ